MISSETTPLIDPDDALLIVSAHIHFLSLCIGIALGFNVRPVAAAVDEIGGMATTDRPLAIVVDHETLGSLDLTDVAVGVGAQLVVVNADIHPEHLRDRVSTALRAAREFRRVTRV